MFMNRRSALYNSCLQTDLTAQICLQEAVQSSIHVHSFSAGQRQNYQRFQNTIATFLCFKNAFTLAFPQMCVHQFKDKIWYGRSLDLIALSFVRPLFIMETNILFGSVVSCDQFDFYVCNDCIPSIQSTNA